MEMKIEPLALPGVDTQRPIVIAGLVAPRQKSKC